jgi:hypothetical protein
VLHYSEESFHNGFDEIRHMNLFFDSYPYYSLYPSKASERTSHIKQLIVCPSVSYKPQQSLKHQLLCIGCVAYALQTSSLVGSGLSFYCELFGRKQQYVQVIIHSSYLMGTSSSSQPRLKLSNPFKPHAHPRTTLSYATLFSSFLIYVMQVSKNGKLDTDLGLDNIRKIVGC